MNSYDDIRTHIDELMHEADKNVVSLATGVLAVSVTFRSSMVPEHPVMLWALGASWIALLTAVLAYVFVLLGKALLWLDVLKTKDFELTRGRLIAIAAPRWLMMTGFVAGMILFATFALANLR